MLNAKKIVTDKDTELIAQAIAKVESETDAELVCAVATESGRYDRAESIMGLLMGVLALGVANLIAHQYQEVGDWSAVAVSLFIQVLAVVMGFVVGSLLASFLLPLRRPFLSKKRMTCEAEKAASFLFTHHSLANTKKRTGVLIYLSLFERRITILADKACREALGDPKIVEICEAAIPQLAAGDFVPAMLFAVDQLATELRQAMPAKRTFDENELADHVLVFHPRCF